MLAQTGGNLLRLRLLVEFGIESRIDGKLSHQEFLELLERHPFGLVHIDGRLVRHHVLDIDFDALAGQGVATTGIDRLTLIVHDIVILEGALTIAEMVLFHLALGFFDRAGEHRGYKGLVVLHAQPVHDARDPFRSEQTHQLVFQRDIEGG